MNIKENLKKIVAGTSLVVAVVAGVGCERRDTHKKAVAVVKDVESDDNDWDGKDYIARNYFGYCGRDIPDGDISHDNSQCRDMRKGTWVVKYKDMVYGGYANCARNNCMCNATTLKQYDSEDFNGSRLDGMDKEEMACAGYCADDCAKQILKDPVFRSKVIGMGR